MGIEPTEQGDRCEGERNESLIIQGVAIMKEGLLEEVGERDNEADKSHEISLTLSHFTDVNRHVMDSV